MIQKDLKIRISGNYLSKNDLVPVLTDDIKFIFMRRASEASLFFLGFPREKKPLHNGSYEHRVPKKIQ